MPQLSMTTLNRAFAAILCAVLAPKLAHIGVNLDSDTYTQLSMAIGVGGYWLYHQLETRFPPKSAPPSALNVEQMTAITRAAASAVLAELKKNGVLAGTPANPTQTPVTPASNSGVHS